MAHPSANRRGTLRQEPGSPQHRVGERGAQERSSELRAERRAGLVARQGGRPQEYSESFKGLPTQARAARAALRDAEEFARMLVRGAGRPESRLGARDARSKARVPGASSARRLEAPTGEGAEPADEATRRRWIDGDDSGQAHLDEPVLRGLPHLDQGFVTEQVDRMADQDPGPGEGVSV